MRSSAGTWLPRVMVHSGRILAVAAAVYGVYRLFDGIFGDGGWRGVALGLALAVPAPVFLWNWGSSMSLLDKREER